MQIHPALLSTGIAERDRELRERAARSRQAPARRKQQPAASDSSPGTPAFWMRIRRREAT